MGGSVKQLGDKLGDNDLLKKIKSNIFNDLIELYGAGEGGWVPCYSTELLLTL